MVLISERVLSIQEPQTLKMARLARELSASGRKVISLSLGEPDFDTPVNIRKAAQKAMDQGITHYPPVAGFLPLRTAISRKLKEENGLEYRPEQVLVSTGAKQSLINAILALINPGDEVLVPAPYWVSYREMVRLAGGFTREIFCPMEQGFKLRPEQLEEAIGPKTRLFLFNSPCNPTGAVYNPEEIQALARILARHPQVFVLTDEIYEYLSFQGPHVSLAAHPELKERSAVVNGFSKAYAMTGWRLGYLAGPEPLIRAAEALQGQFTSGANSIAQMAGLEALEGPRKDLEAMVLAFDQRRKVLHKALSDIPALKSYLPDGAFYIFADVREFLNQTQNSIFTTEDFCMQLLQKYGVSTVCGEAFGMPGHVRISFAASESDLVEASALIRQFMA